VIAAVNGAAIGAAASWRFLRSLRRGRARDFRAHRSARRPRADLRFWLNGAIPQKVALEMSMTGNAIGARRAYELGLINHVVPAAELMERAMALAAGYLCRRRSASRQPRP